MVKIHLLVEPAPKLFLAKVMDSGYKIRGKRTRRVLRTTKVRSKVHTKTSNPGGSSNQPTKVNVKVKMTKSASHHDKECFAPWSKHNLWHPA